MKKTATAFDTLQALCSAWFERRSVEETLLFLAEDFCFVGTGKNDFAHNIVEMKIYLTMDIQKIPEPFSVELTLYQEQEICENTYNVSAGMTLQNTQYQWQLRVLFTVVNIQGDWRFRTLCFSEPSISHQKKEHYPCVYVSENLAKQRHDLLNDSLPGGMMGGYAEDGFPFYFINNRMLDYLGYSNEAQFIADIDGMISNCMHPDDQYRVKKEVDLHLAKRSEYVVEYRMKKRDGSYIWVQDLGRTVTAENGKPAIISVCMDITKQKKNQTEILNIYNNVPGAVFRCRLDQNFSVVEANDGLYEFLGYTREEFIALGNEIASVIYPKDWTSMYNKLIVNAKCGATVCDERRIVCKDGSIKWISLKAQIMPGEDGDDYFYGVFVDITEERLAQERIRELYEKELAYFSQAASAEGSIQGRANVTKDKIENYQSTALVISEKNSTYEEIIRDLSDSAVDPEYGQFIRATLDRTTVLADFSTGKTDFHFEFLRRQKDGAAFWCKTNFRLHQNPESGDVIAFFYTVDITEKKIQEQLLSRVTELEYELISDIDLSNDTYHTASIHPCAEKMLESKGTFQSTVKNIATTYMDEATAKKYISKLDPAYIRRKLKKERSYNFTAKIHDEYGTRVKRYQIFYISQELDRICIARSDVTDLIQQEQQQKEALSAALVAAEQANAAKTDFLSRMSHEIRTPMNAIIGMSTIAAQSIGDDERLTDCISKIDISSRFLLSLINDILDMSRIESGKMFLKSEKISIEDFLNGLNAICYSQSSSNDVEFECIVDPMLDDYYIGDTLKLQQVLLNILSNAIKFTGTGGKVTFSAAVKRKNKTSATLRFIINDTGIGISEEFLPHLFDPFAQESIGTTAEYGGTGLGLTISKNIVDMMGGNIAVRSIKGIGSEFTVDVQLGISVDGIALHSRKKKKLNFSTLKTLVVDDDITVCENTVNTLFEMGVTAEWVDSAHKAIDRVQSLYQTGEHYDMILIDWKMPDIDGIETTRRIRSIVEPTVTIIIMTAYDWTAIEQEAKLAGVNLLMNKPIFKSSLISAFSKTLGEKEEESEIQPIVFDFSKYRALLVEDNAINTEVAAMLLESKGFTVDTAQNGLRAIEMFSKAKTGYYDVILMDIRMPQMDGLTAANNIRHMSNADARTIPIVAMTANAFDDDVEKSKAAGMNAHLAKPIEPLRLYQVLYDLIIGKDIRSNADKSTFAL